MWLLCQVYIGDWLCSLIYNPRYAPKLTFELFIIKTLPNSLLSNLGIKWTLWLKPHRPNYAGFQVKFKGFQVRRLHFLLKTIITARFAYMVVMPSVCMRSVVFYYLYPKAWLCKFSSEVQGFQVKRSGMSKYSKWANWKFEDSKAINKITLERFKHMKLTKLMKMKISQ